MKISSLLTQTDPQISDLILKETHRQATELELIASENYVSPAVLEALASPLANKYSEGYSGHRYYGGNSVIDEVETLAIERAKKLFGAEAVNVQPLSGSPANAAIYLALLQPGDTVLGLRLDHGGHLSHGHPINFSGLMYRFVQYGLNSEGRIDMDQVRELAHKEKPKMIVAGFSAYSRVIDWSKFREIADKVGAYLMVDMAHVAGLVAAGVYPSPVQIADVTTSTTHKTLRGPRGGIILAKSNPELEKKFNSLVFPGIQGGPLMHVIAAKAVAFKEALEPEFTVYQQQVAKNAKVMAETLISRGYKIVSGGTDNHLMLVDLIAKGITGKAADAALGAANITVNKNSVPNDPQSPFVTSGIRVGTGAITTRGFKEAETAQLANWMADVLDNVEDTATIERVKAEVLAICARFPVYPSSNFGDHPA